MAIEPESFHDAVIGGLAELRVGQKAIETHLATLNGSVGKLWHEVRDTQKEIVEHSRDCPLWEKLNELDTQLKSGEHPGSIAMHQRLEKLEVRIFAGEEIDKANNCSRKEWLEWLRPGVWLLLAVIAALVLSHADLFQHKP